VVKKAIHSTTRSYKFNWVDARKTFRDFTFVIIGAALTYLATDIMPMLEKSEDPLVVVLAVPMMTAFLAGAWRFVRNNDRSIA